MSIPITPSEKRRGFQAGAGASSLLLSLFMLGCKGSPDDAAAATVATQSTRSSASAERSAPKPQSTVKKCELVEADDGLVDDLEDGDPSIAESGGRVGKWAVFHDKVSVGGPNNFAPVVEGGADGTKHSAYMKGRVGSADDSWGVKMTLPLNADEFYNASKYAGVSFYARVGKDSVTKVRFTVPDIQTVDKGHLCKACWNHFGTDIELTQEWKKYTVRFDELTQQEGWGDQRPSIDLAHLWQLLWECGEKGTEFEVWIDQVSFMICKQ